MKKLQMCYATLLLLPSFIGNAFETIPDILNTTFTENSITTNLEEKNYFENSEAIALQSKDIVEITENSNNIETPEVKTQKRIPWAPARNYITRGGLEVSETARRKLDFDTPPNTPLKEALDIFTTPSGLTPPSINRLETRTITEEFSNDSLPEFSVIFTEHLKKETAHILDEVVSLNEKIRILDEKITNYAKAESQKFPSIFHFIGGAFLGTIAVKTIGLESFSLLTKEVVEVAYKMKSYILPVMGNVANSFFSLYIDTAKYLRNLY